MARVVVSCACVVTMIAAACGPTHAESEKQETSRRDARSDTAGTSHLDSAVVTPAEIAIGDSVFNRAAMCSPCHGHGGKGTAAAPDLTDQRWINGDGSLGFIEGTIYQGVPYPKEHPLPMPPLGRTLGDRNWHAVAAYVYSLSHPRRTARP
jgi:mono/diheme cytochrome c family protein